MNATKQTGSDAPFLTPEQVERLIKAAGGSGRYRHRDATAVLLAYRHGFRASELCGLKRDKVDLDRGVIHVRRVKAGDPSTQPLGASEIRAIRKLLRESPESPYLFVTERGTPLSTSGFAKIVERAGEVAGLGHCHPHQLRHACGSKLANDGVDTRTIQGYLGHRSIQSTVRYTNLAEGRFKGLFED